MSKNLPTLDEFDTNNAEFLGVQLGYRDMVIFPLDQGLEYIRSHRQCLLLKVEGYGEDRTEQIHRFADEIKIRFYTKEEIQEIIVGQELLLRGNSDE